MFNVWKVDILGCNWFHLLMNKFWVVVTVCKVG